ncbi:MAG: cation:proton antiporter [Flavobacteriales bacterium]|nr:cation:proton antiporter [Flavobacteriales bacterium]
MATAAVTSMVFKWLKQPVVLGYLLAGLLVGPNVALMPTVHDTEGIKVWAEIGVIFLLFGLGLEFSFKKLIRIGGVAGITAVIEVLLTMLTGYLLGRMLGWALMDCLFLGGILAIASTTIIIRSFEELGVKSQKFAGLVTGILIIEDLVAVVLMVVLSTVSISMSFEGTEMVYSILKLSFFLILWFLSGIFFLPSLFRMTKKFLSEEMLLILSVALCLVMVLLANEAGFSPALGAFIMGSILAETRKAEKIEHVIGPLKVVFGAVFFVSVGMLIDVNLMIEYYVPILLGTCILLFAKPLYVIGGALISGQTLKTSVQTGMSLSQIGEFSFIIASLGLSLNVISGHLYPIAVAISVITTFTTPFMIRLSKPFHSFLERKLPVKLQKSLVQYSVGTQKASEISEWREYVRASIINVVVFSVVVVSAIIFSNKYLSFVYFGNEWSQLATTIVTLILLSPFLWALSFRGVKKVPAYSLNQRNAQRGPMYVIHAVRIGLSIFLIGLLFNTFYSPIEAFVGVIITCLILFLLRGRIQAYYDRIERRFMTNLNSRDNAKRSELNVLAPWDSHIATFEMHPAMSIIGKPLFDLKLRERFGINVAVVKRGDIVINVPDRFERIYPNDVVSFIGTDVQLNKFREEMDEEVTSFEIPKESKTVSLQHFTIDESSFLIGKSIRNSGIRELTKGLIVGIEREGDRFLNPESNFILQANDTLWMVGDQKRILVLSRRQTV